MTDLYVQALGPSDAAVSLIVIHGGMGLDHSYFRPYLDPLADRARLVYFDQRLGGRSPRSSAARVDLAAMTQDALDVAKSTCVGPTVAVGHSFGALVALSMAVAEPAAIQGLVCIGHGLSPTLGNTLLTYMAEAGDEIQRRSVGQAFALELKTDEEYADAWRAILPLYFHDFAASGVGLIDRVSCSVKAFNEFLRHGFGHVDYRAELARLQVPVLFIGGESDWCERDPSGGSVAAAALAPQGRAVMIPEAGHFPFVEQPGRCLAAINDWLDDLIRRRDLASG